MEKSRDYETEFETPYIVSMTSFYDSEAITKGRKYSQFLDWFNDAMNFEIEVTKKTLFYSNKLVKDKLK